MLFSNYVKSFIVVGVLLALSLAGYKLYHNGYESGKTEVQTKWDTDKLNIANSSLILLEEERLRAKTLQKTLETERTEHDKSVKAASTKYASLVNSVSKRQNRPTTNESSAVKGTGATTADRPFCDGSRLYREDATFLASEAHTATVIQNELKSCIQQYEAVRASINAD